MFADLIKKQVQGAFAILGDLAPAHTYVSTDTGGSTYDPATGTMIEVSTEYPDVKMVLTSFSVKEMDDQVITLTDLKVLIASEDLPVQPKEQDLIYLTNGQTYMIERILGVPGESLHILHVRKTRRPT